MQRLKTLWTRDPGLFCSTSLHGLAVLCLIVNFAWPQTSEDQTEAVSVEMVTTSDLNQIMNGEDKAKPLPQAQRRVDKVAELEDHHPAPPLADALKDTPSPPSPDKANDDPGQDDKPTPAAAAPPPPPPPTPPARPVETEDAPQPPAKPADLKPPPPDAEALEAKPPPKPVPMPQARPTEIKQARAAPPKVTPPAPPRKPHERTEPKETLDDVAKLLATLKPPKPVTHARAGSDTPDAPRHEDFNLDKITALIDHEAPQRRASTGRALTQMASLGSPTAHADKMSPSMTAQLDGWLVDHYRGCWSYFGLGATSDYVPSVRVRMAPDGSLIGQPDLLNPPSDPNLRSLADSAIRAVNRCNPMPVPDRFKPYYDAWRLRVVRFDPKEMS